MFERYTEQARRALFFARYEATQMGGSTIDTPHLLLGLLREGKGVVSRISAQGRITLDNARSELGAAGGRGPTVSTASEIPFSPSMKQVLIRAADESSELQHPSIGTEHLLLAMLHEDTGPAGALLLRRGLTHKSVRAAVAAHHGLARAAGAGGADSADSMESAADDAAERDQTIVRIGPTHAPRARRSNHRSAGAWSLEGLTIREALAALSGVAEAADRSSGGARRRRPL